MSAPAGSRCAWPGCPVTAKRGRLMCYRHWVSLPKELRELVWQHYRPGQTALTCTPEYRDALRDVLAYARRVNAEAEQQAAGQRQAKRDQETFVVSAGYPIRVASYDRPDLVGYSEPRSGA